MAETVNDLGNGITMTIHRQCGVTHKSYYIDGEPAVARLQTGGIYIYSNRLTSEQVPRLAAVLLLAMDSGFTDTDRNKEQTHMEGNSNARAIEDCRTKDSCR